MGFIGICFARQFTVLVGGNGGLNIARVRGVSLNGDARRFLPCKLYRFDSFFHVAFTPQIILRCVKVNLGFVKINQAVRKSPVKIRIFPNFVK